MMTRLKHAYIAWIRLPFNRHALLFETVLVLALAKLAKFLVPFRILSRVLGRQVSVDVALEDQLPPALYTELVWVFGVWKRYWPYPPVCLTEVMALKIMLLRRKIPCAIFIGVTSDPREGFQAHAWMRCGHTVLPRKQQLDHYKVISVFAD